MSADGRIAEAEAHGVARLTLDRPAKINALSAVLMGDLAARLRRLGARADLGLIVIQGAGPRGLCAGADVVEVVQGGVALEAQLDALSAVVLALEGSAVPIGVLAHGRCFGAGGMLVALADLVLAADDLSLGFPEVAIGLYPAMVHAVLRTRLAETLAAQLSLGGRLLSAAEAYAIGLATEVLPASQFASAVEDRLAYYLARRAALRSARTMRPRRADLADALCAARRTLIDNHADPAAHRLLHGFLTRREH